MRAVLLVLGCSACATTTSVCPVGAKRVDVQEQRGRAQWCTTVDQRLELVPTAGRDYTGVVGSQPRKMTGGVQGPFTSWYASGSVESHGHYLDFGSRSVPDGLWGFWYPNGQRRTIGMYRRGEPVGCFASWDQTGTRSTGFVEGTELRVAPCTPPADDELAIIEGSASGPAESAPWADISLHGFFGPGGIGASNPGQVDPDPALSLGFQLAARMRLGRLRVGPIIGLRLSDNTDYRGHLLGGVLAVGLPALHPRLDTEASIELGAQYITATAIRRMQDGTAKLAFWSPLGAAQLTAAFELSPFLAAVASVRVDGAPSRDSERQVSYCVAGGCLAPQPETWTVGGFAYGLNLGLRLVLR
jgi:hypothetical protein